MANKLPTFLQSGTNNYQTPVLSYNRLATDLVAPGFIGTLTNTSGVSPATGAFAVNAQGTPNMSVDIAAGNLYITATPSGGIAQTLNVNMSTNETLAIGSNTTGATVYDFVYVVMDATKMNNPAVTGLDVASFFVSRSSTATTNSNGTIANSLLIAEIAVANNATSITNANITDRRVRSGVNSLGASVTLPTTTVVNSRSLTNPYKFSAYRNAAWTDGSSAYVKVTFDTEEFDTGSNYDTTNGRFTAPIAGFYYFSALSSSTVTGGQVGQVALYKNGAAFKVGTGSVQGAATVGMARLVSLLIQLAANDYVEVFSYGTGGVGGVGASSTYFSGFLVSTT